MSAEEWRPIPTAPGYEASSFGRIKSVQRGQGRRVGRIMSQHPMSNQPYVKVDLRIDGRRVTRKVHRLVGDAFLGPLPPGLETRHLNGDASDNRVENLCYGTHVENTQDAIQHGTHPSVAARARTHCAKGHPYDERTRRAPNGSRICARCDVIKTIAGQKRALARREAAGEVTPHLIRAWASAVGIASTGRLSSDLKWLYALAHPEKNWRPAPDPRPGANRTEPTIADILGRHPEWSKFIETRELRAA